MNKIVKLLALSSLAFLITGCTMEIENEKIETKSDVTKKESVENLGNKVKTFELNNDLKKKRRRRRNQ